MRSGCELVLALDALGQRERARRVFGWTRSQRTDNGAYWTGATHPERVVFPEGEQTTWTASAVIIAQDALFADSRTSSFFRDLDGHDLEVRHEHEASVLRRKGANTIDAPNSAAE